MSFALTLLAEVRWRGRPVAGDRPQALLAALAARVGRLVPADELIELVWGGEAPHNGMKSLQVLVSRARAACGADAIVTDGTGYRLGAKADEVDSARLAALVRDATAALDRDTAAAAALARKALALTAGLPGAAVEDFGPLAEVRRAAAADTAAAETILGQAASRTGAHADALPALELAHAQRPRDEALLADLLRSEAAVRGPAAALERFERYRADLRERLGTDPGEALQRAHRGLLALDRPVRRGIRYDATTLIGRDDDLHRLRALLSGSRVVSIVGTGGLGKTRLANALARTAAEPAVYVVELAGVTAGADVAGEVGSALGVRDSVSHRVLTAEQRADVRSRIAQLLGQSPALLVLDNCEHLIGAVADLVAFLVAATPDLRVLTTSRAPLAIAAERVYLLGELGTGDAARLFTERATAARPSVRLTEALVASIVARLDGLPLAIELAAARVRTMALEEIDRRLADRFALLRGGDRSAPGRHQTLFAVIDWSWNLLNAEERRALRRLALFRDGFTLEAAEAVLDVSAGEHVGAGQSDAADSLEAVQGLVDQSLLSVRETLEGGRYRMLETVREFGLLRLADAGEDAGARAAQRRWAVAYARAHAARGLGREQFAAIDALGAEEINLADELRGAIADGDRCSLVQLLTALGLFWTLRGEHVRLLVLAETVAHALQGWAPPTDLVNVTSAAVSVTLSNALITNSPGSGVLRGILQGLPWEEHADVHLTGLIRVLLAHDPAATDPGALVRRLEQLAASQDRHTALAASQWLSVVRENAGDAAGAVQAARRTLALAREDEGPWATAMPNAMLAQLTMHLGDRAAAVGHARAALSVMRRLGASDDEMHLRSLLVLCAVADGRLADARDELARMDALGEVATLFGSDGRRQACHAELALASGDYAAGLRAYRECAARMRAVRIPGFPSTGLEPWVIFGDAAALSAHARYAAGGDQADGRALFLTCRDSALRMFRAPDPDLDYPAAGLLVFALGAWALLRWPEPGEAAPGSSAPETMPPETVPAEIALRLLALADRFAYNRMIPSMNWDWIASAAEKSAPGRLTRFQAEYGGRQPADLLTEGRRLAELLPG